MSNQLTIGPIVQGTSLYGPRPNQLVTGGTLQPTSQACISDFTPPTFSGITFLGRDSLGQFTVSWSSAVDATLPIRYEVYIQALTSFNLFDVANIALITPQLSCDLFALADSTLLQSGVLYHVGVRAVDAVGNRDNNTTSMSQISVGIAGITFATVSGIFAIDENNNLIGSFWASDSLGTIENPLRLGAGSYVLYDKNGNLVPGMSQTGITPDSEGFYEIAPIPSILDLEHNFYAAKTTVVVDGIPVTYTLPVTYGLSSLPIYEPRAVFSINPLNQLEGTIWVTRNGERLTSAIGTAAFTIYDKDRNPVGISQSGLTANGNGYYKTTAVSAATLAALTHYTVSIQVTANGELRSGAVGLTIAE